MTLKVLIYNACIISFSAWCVHCDKPWLAFFSLWFVGFESKEAEEIDSKTTKK